MSVYSCLTSQSEADPGTVLPQGRSCFCSLTLLPPVERGEIKRGKLTPAPKSLAWKWPTLLPLMLPLARTGSHGPTDYRETGEHMARSPPRRLWSSWGLRPPVLGCAHVHVFCLDHQACPANRPCHPLLFPQMFTEDLLRAPPCTQPWA